MSSRIHPLACVDPSAELGDEVEVGPFSVVGAGVRIGSGTVLANNVTVIGDTTIGERNQIYPGAVIGAAPQDVKYRGEATRVVVGDENVIREQVTVNRGTMKDAGVTTVGNRNLIMACCHIAHDCLVEDGVIMANGVLLAGHVHVERHAIFGGAVGVHHFVTVGRYAFVGGFTRVVRDVPPYMTTEGHPARVWCVNVEGLKRNGFSPEAIAALKEAYKAIFRTEGVKRAAFEELERNGATEEVRRLIAFLRAGEGGRKGRAREALRRVR